MNKQLYGDVDKILAAEWAKFRWGVFDDRNIVTPIKYLDTLFH